MPQVRNFFRCNQKYSLDAAFVYLDPYWPGQAVVIQNKDRVHHPQKSILVKDAKKDQRNKQY